MCMSMNVCIYVDSMHDEMGSFDTKSNSSGGNAKRAAAQATNTKHDYGVATISRLLKIIGLFCRISSLLQGSFAKKTYNFKEPTNRSHPIRTTSRSAPTVSSTISNGTEGNSKHTAV